MQDAKISRTPTWVFAPVVNAMLLLGEFNRRRQVRSSCGRLSAALLRDMGVTPDDLEAALGRPLDRDASEELVREAVARVGNW